MPWKVALSFWWSVVSSCLKHYFFHPELPGDITYIKCTQKSTYYSGVSDTNLKCSHNYNLQQSEKQKLSIYLSYIPGSVFSSIGASSQACVEQDRKWLCKNTMPSLLSSFPLHSIQDKFTPQEPFVGCTAQAICSFLGERQLTLHLSPPAAGYNSTHFEPLSRGADGGPGIRIPHHNGSAGKQKTDELGPLSSPLRKRSKCTWHWMTGTQDEHTEIVKNTNKTNGGRKRSWFLPLMFFLLLILVWKMSFLLLLELPTHMEMVASISLCHTVWLNIPRVKKKKDSIDLPSLYLLYLEVWIF